MAATLWCHAAGAIVWDAGRPEVDVVTPQVSSHRFSGVGRISGCTATPIAPDLVVSAAHCFEDGAGNVYNASQFSFHVEFEDQGDVWIRALRLAIHPDYPMCHTYPCGPDGTSQCMPRGCFRGDLALVWLAADLPSHVKIYPLGSFVSPPVGATVAHVGYGRGGTGIDGDNQLSGTRRYGFNRITGVSPYEGALQTVFDASGYATPCVGKGCFFDAATWSRIREVTTARGDSGGPLFYNPTRDYEANPPPYQIKLLPDEEFLIGVTSHGDASSRRYGATGGYTFLGPYHAWIRAQDPQVQVASQAAPMVPLADAPIGLVDAQTLPEAWNDCRDGIDNDGDGLLDMGDPGCVDPTDPNETALDLECDDGRDNDGDGKVDGADEACLHPLMALEAPACSDGVDNDGDGGTDFDGGATGRPDADCAGHPWGLGEAPSRCGLGFELALLLPAIAAARRGLGRAPPIA